MWVLTYKGTDKLHLLGQGVFDPTAHDMSKLDYYDIPDQPVQHLYRGDPPQLVGTLADLRQYTSEEKAALIDRDTGRAIDETIHPFAGLR